MKIVFATGNEGKMREIREIMADVDAEIFSMKEAGIVVDIVEDGTSFEENAMIKAKAVAEALGRMAEEAGSEADAASGGAEEAGSEANAASGRIEAGKAAVAAWSDAIVLADDSGLEIDYLNGEPGIYSARYMGEDTSYEIKNQALIERLDGVAKEQRTARFVCAIAAALPDGKTLMTRGTMEGYIGFAPSGKNGFGYDPILYLEEYGCASADLEPEQKNEISHRGKALRQMRELLRDLAF